MTLQQIEQALAEGRVSTLMSNGNWWAVRRNGRTRTWKTRPGEFRIPIKFGLRGYGEITHRSSMDGTYEYKVAS